MRTRFLAALFSCSLAFAPFSVVEAMSVTPIVIDMSSVGRDGRSQISVTNTAAGDIPVAITVEEATVSPTGVVTTAPAGDLFVIYPTQALIKPGATQRFRVQWAGEPDLAKSRTFIFSAAQQPVALPDGVSGIQILYNFEVVVSVAPPRQRATMNIADAGFEMVEGKRRAALTIFNPGNVHAYLSGARLQLEGKDAAGKQLWAKTLTPEELAQVVGIGLVQPGAKRRFILPIDLPEGGETITASVRYVGRQ
jgi:fimbrial chaperone protein